MGIKNWDTDAPTYKGRVVLQGSNMKDYHGNEVFYADTSSAPTSMGCIRSSVTYGSLFPHEDPNLDGSSTVADAEQAYIQRTLEPDENLFVIVPKEMWTPKMHQSAIGIDDPVFRLLRPLYGWSRSGNLWEKHLSETVQTMLSEEERSKINAESIALQSIETARETCRRIEGKDGWVPLDGWPQTFYKLGSLGKPIILTVYVDDMIMSGPGHRCEWERLRKLIRTTEPAPISRVLGVNFEVEKVSEFKTKIVMDMTKYCEQTVLQYLDVQDAPSLKASVKVPWYEPSPEEVVNSSQPINESQCTIFGHCASSLLMRALYMARMIRLDCIYTINHLSKFVSKWNKLCDKQMCHLFSYLQNSAKTKMVASVDTRDLKELRIEAYPDADLAGNFTTAKSTSGGFLAVTGPHGTFMPLEWFSKRQTATSHSTTEAEMVAMSKILRESLVPQMGLWSLMVGYDVPGIIFEDNQSTIVVAKNGYSPQLRHLAKHHRISLGLVHDFLQHPDLTIQYITTDKQKGDLLTKGLSRAKHDEAMRMVGLESNILASFLVVLSSIFK
jgi:hypothetical protein